jgi:broad specificity phosphatase PhoE
MGGYRLQAPPGVLIILMRHGKTTGNNPSNPQVRGWKDAVLTSEGRMDVQLTAQKLRKYDPQWIVSSDFMRDTETAQIVATQLNINNIETNWQCRTWDTGAFSGQPETEVNPQILEIYKHPWESAPGGFESMNEFMARWQAFLDSQMDLAANVECMRPGIVVTHGRNIAATDAYLNGKNTWEADMPNPAGFACVEVDEVGYLSLRFVGAKEPVATDV